MFCGSQFEILQIKWKKWKKEHHILSLQFFTNIFSILMFFVLFFHVVCKISNSDKPFGAGFLYWLDFNPWHVDRKVFASIPAKISRGQLPPPHPPPSWPLGSDCSADWVLSLLLVFPRITNQYSNFEMWMGEKKSWLKCDEILFYFQTLNFLTHQQNRLVKTFDLKKNWI